MDTIAVLDPQAKAAVWAVQGPWRAQHDAQFLENGHLLIFDNLGSPRGSRVLEYDPQTCAFPWSYPLSNMAGFLTKERGMCQRLPNGNTLIVDPDNRRLLEVTPDKELVWESVLSPVVSQSATSPPHAINGARRYRADELTFLKDVTRARP